MEFVFTWTLYVLLVVGAGLWIRHLYAVRRNVVRENERLAEQLGSTIERLNLLSAGVQELEGKHRELFSRFRHDCMNPLGSIKGFVALLRDPHFGELNDRQRRCVENIERSSEGLLNLVEATSKAIPLEEPTEAAKL